MEVFKNFSRKKLAFIYFGVFIILDIILILLKFQEAYLVIISTIAILFAFYFFYNVSKFLKEKGYELKKIYSFSFIVSTLTFLSTEIINFIATKGYGSYKLSSSVHISKQEYIILFFVSIIIDTIFVGLFCLIFSYLGIKSYDNSRSV